jgi:hypothetical protein
MLSDSLQHAEEFLGWLLISACSSACNVPALQIRAAFQPVEPSCTGCKCPNADFLLSPVFKWSTHSGWAQERIPVTAGRYKEISLLCLVMGTRFTFWVFKLIEY